MRCDLRVAAGALCAVLLSACGGDREKAEAASRETPRAGTLGTDGAPDLEALRDTVIARARRGDAPGLVRLMVDDSAYRHRVYPASPAYDPDQEGVFDLVLGMHKANTAKGLRRLLADVRDTARAAAGFLNEEFRGTEVTGGVLYESAERPGARGIRPFGSALCAEGVCRVLSFSRAGFQGKDP